jgi:hypothetical protein
MNVFVRAPGTVNSFRVVGAPPERGWDGGALALILS